MVAGDRAAGPGRAHGAANSAAWRAGALYWAGRNSFPGKSRAGLVALPECRFPPAQAGRLRNDGRPFQRPVRRAARLVGLCRSRFVDALAGFYPAVMIKPI